MRRRPRILRTIIPTFLLGAIAISCTTGDAPSGSSAPASSPYNDTAQPSAEQAELLLERAGTRMSTIGSFRLVEIIEPDGGEHWFAEFVAPDTYRILQYSYETVLWGDTSYSRECEGSTCGSWSTNPRDDWDTWLDPTGTFGHRWLLSALELAEEPELVEVDPDSGLLLLHADINPIKALFDSMARPMEGDPTGPSGNPCLPAHGQPAPDPCEEYDPEEAIDSAQPGYEIFENDPANLEVWMRADGVVENYVVTVNSNGYIQHIIHTYTGINKTTIDPPGGA